MTVQDGVGLLTLAAIALVAAVFIYVIANAGKSAEAAQVQKQWYAIRRWWFIALLVFGVIVTWASLKPFPIANQHSATSDAQIVEAVGRQWSWTLSTHRVSAGVPVEFRVTSEDVNHGFAIYGPDEHIVTQTQAMPGFTNRLVHTFTVPGKYRVMCLEYCGLAHHVMTTEFDVAPEREAGL